MPKRRRVVLLTTSKAGVKFAQGLERSGHDLVAVGRGVSRHGGPIGAISRHELQHMVGPEIPIADIEVDSSREAISFLQANRHDVTVISWPKILGPSVLHSGGHFFVGTHPTPLPLGRGRHPLHWMRVLGLRRSTISAFRVDDGIDSGPIVATVRFSILPWRDINSDMHRLERRMALLGLKLGLKLLFGYPNGHEQADGNQTTWRKRTEADTQIDFRMSTKGIVQHVRSFSHPFPLASVELSGVRYRVHHAKSAPFALFSSKTRWSIFGQTVRRVQHRDGSFWVLVRCFDGAVWLALSDYAS